MENVFDNDFVTFKTIDDEQVSFVLNGHRFRLYHKPVTREKFVKSLSRQPNIEVVSEGNIPPYNPT